jgi:hypothetical protein
LSHQNTLSSEEDKGFMLFIGDCRWRLLSKACCNRTTQERNMPMVRPSFALLLGLLLAPIVATGAMAQDVQKSVPPPNPASSFTGTAKPDVGSGANNSMPDPSSTAIDKKTHVKKHKRTHKHMYGKHYNVMKHSHR